MTVAPIRSLAAGPAAEASAGVALQAGPLSLWFQDGDLRRVRWGDREVLRRVYGAVRDRHWGTVPGVVSRLQLEAEDKAFQIRYRREHRDRDIHFVWEAEILGEADGTLRFTFDGEAKSTFLSNRIGLCVLHPIRECAGGRCRTSHGDGSNQLLGFPEWVSVEQPVTGFTDLRGLAHEVEPGVWLELEFTGDAFETEDQRNWIDASFKTYSTPLRLPIPVAIQPGTRIRQSVVARLRTDHPEEFLERITPVEADPIVIRRRGGGTCRVPELGLGAASDGVPLKEQEVERLAVLGPSHLRLDLRLAEPQWAERLWVAAGDAAKLGAALEVALHLPADGPGNLPAVVSQLGQLPVKLARVGVFRDGQRSTLPADLAAVRAAFGDVRVSLGSGTDGDLYSFHLQPPAPGGDYLCWSMNPQVHATDDWSLAETPEAVVHQLASMRRRHPGRPLVVSPVTLKPRGKAVGSGTHGVGGEETWRSPKDARLASPFGATWTVALLQALGEAEVASVTWFETSGCLGILPAQDGSGLSTPFPCQPSSVTPVYHVLTDVREFAQGRVWPTESSEPSVVASLLLGEGTRRRLLLANLSTRPRRVSWGEGGGKVRARWLDETTWREALNRPLSFRASSTELGSPEILLRARAVATLDFSAS